MIQMTSGNITKKFTDFGMLIEEGHGNPITPGFNHLTKKNPNRAGMLKFSEETGVKLLRLNVFIKESDWAQREQRFNELKSFLFDDFGNSRTIRSVLEYEPDKYVDMQCTAISEPVRKKEFARFDVEFTAYDPYKYSLVNADEVTWGSEVITFGSMTYTFGHESPQARYLMTTPQTIHMAVMGLALQPFISIWGKATNLVLTNQGKKIYVGTFSNVRIEIDCEKYIAYEAGVEKMIRMDKFFLRQGMNHINFSADSMDIDVTIKYRDRWK